MSNQQAVRLNEAINRIVRGSYGNTGDERRAFLRRANMTRSSIRGTAPKAESPKVKVNTLIPKKKPKAKPKKAAPKVKKAPKEKKPLRVCEVKVRAHTRKQKCRK